MGPTGEGAPDLVGVLMAAPSMQASCPLLMGKAVYSLGPGTFSRRHSTSSELQHTLVMTPWDPGSRNFSLGLGCVPALAGTPLIIQGHPSVALSLRCLPSPTFRLVGVTEACTDFIVPVPVGGTCWWALGTCASAGLVLKGT